MGSIRLRAVPAVLLLLLVAGCYSYTRADYVTVATSADVGHARAARNSAVDTEWAALQSSTPGLTWTPVTTGEFCTVQQPVRFGDTANAVECHFTSTRYAGFDGPLPDLMRELDTAIAMSPPPWQAQLPTPEQLDYSRQNIDGLIAAYQAGKSPTNDVAGLEGITYGSDTPSVCGVGVRSPLLYLSEGWAQASSESSVLGASLLAVDHPLYESHTPSNLAAATDLLRQHSFTAILVAHADCTYPMA